MFLKPFFPFSAGPLSPAKPGPQCAAASGLGLLSGSWPTSPSLAMRRFICSSWCVFAVCVKAVGEPGAWRCVTRRGPSSILGVCHVYAPRAAGTSALDPGRREWRAHCGHHGACRVPLKSAGVLFQAFSCSEPKLPAVAPSGRGRLRTRGAPVWADPSPALLRRRIALTAGRGADCGPKVDPGLVVVCRPPDRAGLGHCRVQHSETLRRFRGVCDTYDPISSRCPSRTPVTWISVLWL